MDTNREMKSSDGNNSVKKVEEQQQQYFLVPAETKQAHYDVLVSTIKEKMDTVFPPCICRVPETLARRNEKAYYPDMISIGPFHHGRLELKSMEDHKWRYLHALLSRKPNLEANLDACVKALRDCELKARNCYKEREAIELSHDEFVTMMLVDGCFMIELFLKYSFKSLRKRGDPIFTLHETIRTLRRDLILLENQYPLFVLQRLFNLVPIPDQCSKPLNLLAYIFFRSMIPGNRKATQEKFSQEGNHLLDLIHNCFLPTFSETHPGDQQRKQNRQRTRGRDRNPEENIKSACKLHDSGILLRKKESGILLDIEFSDGVLYIPEVKIHQYYTETLFRNLIAGEQCNCDNFEHVTSYILLMKELIRSEKDVKYLKQKKILSGTLEKDEEVSKLFQNLSDELERKQSYFQDLYEQVKKYKSSFKNWFPVPSCLQK